jgi:hypothetical protein
MQRSFASVLLVVLSCLCSRQLLPQARGLLSGARDSAVYVALRGDRPASIAPTARDLRGWLGADETGKELAQQLLGFDATLITQLHTANPSGRGPGIALRLRPELLTQSPDSTVYRPGARLNLQDASIIRERLPYVAYRVELEFSVVQYAASGDVAVVWEATRCGPLCGGSRYVVVRQTPSGSWVITGVYQTAVS